MEEIIKTKEDGLNFCAKFAFKPNQLKYCGPSNERTLFEYAATGIQDQGLIELLRDFETMYPYLRLIAKANEIKDPFDKRVVEAYWLGNSLLKNVEMKDLFMCFIDDHHLRKRLPPKYFQEIVMKIPQGAKPHHSFHVLNVFLKTGQGHFKIVIKTMEKCMISAGEVKALKKSLRGKDYSVVNADALVYEEGGIKMKKAKKRVNYKFKGQAIIDQINIGDKVALHWDFVCEKITSRQAKQLEAWNQYHLNMANLTI